MVIKSKNIFNLKIHKLKKYTNNMNMIYFIGILVGLLNGLFASGAGQILVFYLIFILKKDTHMSRALSVSLLSISSIFAIFGYSKLVDLKIDIIITLIFIAIVSGLIGTKLMKKIPADILNLFSGVLIVSLTIYKMISRRCLICI